MYSQGLLRPRRECGLGNCNNERRDRLFVPMRSIWRMKRWVLTRGLRAAGLDLSNSYAGSGNLAPDAVGPSSFVSEPIDSRPLPFAFVLTPSDLVQNFESH